MQKNYNKERHLDFKPDNANTELNQVRLRSKVCRLSNLRRLCY